MDLLALFLHQLSKLVHGCLSVKVAKCIVQPGERNLLRGRTSLVAIEDNFHMVYWVVLRRPPVNGNGVSFLLSHVLVVLVART
ncbi:hypothetical protein QG37_07592 [Candidozyma auris]|nr:hypothetical protein QG37_07592 [[Candida] auris]